MSNVAVPSWFPLCEHSKRPTVLAVAIVSVFCATWFQATPSDDTYAVKTFPDLVSFTHAFGNV